MKKCLILLLGICFLYTSHAQTTFWTVYTMKVKPGQEQSFTSSLDQFFKSETGKKLPTASVASVFFANSESEATHQVVFASQDKSMFNAMYSPAFAGSSDFQIMSLKLDQISEPVASYLGKAIDYTPMPQNPFSMILQMNVSDPATYVPEWKKLNEAIKNTWEGKIGMSLHQVLSGNEEDVTHITVVSAPDFASLLDFGDKIYTTSAFREFNAKVKDIREVVSNTTLLTSQRYNLPE